MKRLLAVALGAFLVAGPASAQSAGNTADSELSVAPSTDGRQQTPLSGTTTADLLGREVVNNAGQAIGQVRDLVIDPSDGEITHMIVGIGQYLGAGERDVALPWNDVDVAPERIVTSMSRDELARAEPYRRGMAQPQQAERR